eukprot:748400-Hanusia_phi.AAC.11
MALMRTLCKRCFKLFDFIIGCHCKLKSCTRILKRLPDILSVKKSKRKAVSEVTASPDISIVHPKGSAPD